VNPLTCYIEYYNCTAALVLENGKNFPVEINSINITGNFSNYL